ncbi:MAG: hypothetical protein CSA42_00320 [Gammaproteobacteria bacterium]|nr:MAG: hypothetical protein CSB21_00020 [Deltaproteobacteria bacterium]PIE48132.1 MAG: hypothetical protein CSA42_00320 [Gammaproteobacteria bacterium]
MNLSDLSTQKKLRTNISLFIFFFLFFSCATLYSFNKVKGLFAEVKVGSVPVIIAILEIKSTTIRLFAEIQGFVVSGDENETEDFQKSVERFDKWMEKWLVRDKCSYGLSLRTKMKNYRDVFISYGKSIFTTFLKRQESIKAFTDLGSKMNKEVEKALETCQDAVAQKELTTLGNTIDLLRIETYRLISKPAEEDEEEEGEKASESKDEVAEGYDEGCVFTQERLTSIYGTLETAKASWAGSGNLSVLIEKAIYSSKDIVKKTKAICELLEKVEEYEDEILGVLDKAVVHQTKEVNDAFHGTTSAVNTYTIFLAVAGIIFICTAFMLSRLIANSITLPLAHLMGVVKTIARGDLSKRVEQVGKDEVGQLGLYFNEMTEQLEKTTVSREYLDNILSNMTESLVVLSPMGEIETANTATLTLLGYQNDELVGEGITQLLMAASASDEQKRSQKNLIEKIQQSHKDTIQRIEGFYYTKDGMAVPVLLSCSIISDKEGNEKGFVCVASDITKIKQIQQELEDSYINLQKVQDQLIQSSKLASIGELAAGVAHELNQPLMIIRTGSQILERKMKKGGLDRQQIDKHLDSILSNSKRMMNIIDHLRTFSRQSSVSFSPVSLNKVIENCFYMTSEQLRLKNISISEELAADLPMINGDANQIEQVILNLLTNAKDALEDKFADTNQSGDLQKEIALTTRISPDDSNMVELLVHDNGTGVPVDKKDRIFDPFFTTKEEGKGTGLGLSISYGIIQDHKGIIDIAETNSQGTTFRIRLPIIP